MYYLKHEWECFIRYEMRGAVERFISHKTRSTSFVFSVLMSVLSMYINYMAECFLGIVYAYKHQLNSNNLKLQQDY